MNSRVSLGVQWRNETERGKTETNNVRMFCPIEKKRAASEQFLLLSTSSPSSNSLSLSLPSLSLSLSTLGRRSRGRRWHHRLEAQQGQRRLLVGDLPGGQLLPLGPVDQPLEPKPGLRLRLHSLWRLPGRGARDLAAAVLHVQSLWARGLARRRVRGRRRSVVGGRGGRLREIQGRGRRSGRA